MEIKLTVNEAAGGNGDPSKLDGMHVFGSVVCPKHEMGVLIVVPQTKVADIHCLMSSIQTVAEMLMDAARKKHDEN